MNKHIFAAFAFVALAMSITAQTSVTTSGGTTNTVPVFTGSSTVGNSNITQVNGYVGIEATSPISALQVGSGINTTNHLSLLVPNWDTTAGYASFVGGWSAAGYWGIGALNGSTTPTVQIGNVPGNLQEYDGPWASTQNLNLVVGGSVGVGTTTPAYKLDVAGQIRSSSGGVVYPDGTTQITAFTGVLCGGDYAESVDVTGTRTNYEPGDLLVIDPNDPGRFLKSAEPYSTLVAGIYSTKPGAVGRRQATAKSPDEVPMAMIGIVPTKVSAENGSIKTGDLLVSASTKGYAMKGTDRSRLVGAVVGKAMGSLEIGTGVIEVLVTLQ